MDDAERIETYERNVPRLPTDQKDIVGESPGLSNHYNDVIASNLYVCVMCIINVYHLSSELQMYVWSGGERMVRAFPKIHHSQRCMWFGLFF